MKIPRLSVPAALLLAGLGVALPAHAKVYWQNADLLGDFFQKAKNPDRKVGYKPVRLSQAEADAIGKQIGAPVKTNWNVYLAEDGPKRVGYAVLDAELGLHELIDYGVHFDPAGTIQRIEIREYREPYGDEVRLPRYRQQFVGKTARDPITAGQDISIITGASISSKSVALGVKRDTLVVATALKNGQL